MAMAFLLGRLLWLRGTKLCPSRDPSAAFVLCLRIDHGAFPIPHSSATLSPKIRSFSRSVRNSQ